jgi:hypothetical protein
MVLSFLYLAFVRTLQLVRLSRSDNGDLAVEVVILRHEVAGLRRQITRPGLRLPDRAILGGLSRPLSRQRHGRFFVQPETLLRWHRDLVRRHWTYAHGPGRPSIPASTAAIIVRAWPRRTPPGGYRRIERSSPDWVSPWPLRASGSFCAGTTSIPHPPGQVPAGRSSFELRPRPCWPTTSSPSIRCS